MDSKETNGEQEHPPHRKAVALKGPSSTSQAMHDRLTVGALSPRKPQSQQPPMLNGSPYSVASPDVVDVDVDGGGENANSSASPAKRKGRPPGSRSKQRNALEGGGGSFTAHIIDVDAGEDIAAEVIAFLNQEPRDVCILSASGAVSMALLQSNTPLGVVSYEGLYQITGMSGAFLNTEIDGAVTRTGNLKVFMAGPDCKIVWGFVGGMLVAGSQTQVVVGTYGQEKLNLSAGRVENNPEPASAPASVSLSGGGLGIPQSSEETDTRFVWRPVPMPQPRHRWPGNNPQ